MRQIKFRAWMGTTMEYRVVAGLLGAFYVEGLDPKDAACISPFNTKYSEQTPVMQFTGLKDKNGKEIWEGDIVFVGETWIDDEDENNPVEKRDGRNFQVKWFGDGDYPAFDLSPNLDTETNGLSYLMCANEGEIIEVIGNIYENPELLKPTVAV